MYRFFQNLNDHGKKLYHFRGSIGPDYNRIWLKYELVSGFDFRFRFKIKSYPKISLTIGYLFGTAYLTLPFFKFKVRESLVSGFYFYHWAFVWDWMRNENEWSRGTPKWRHLYFHIDDFFLGKSEAVNTELLSEDDIYFSLGGKEFKMDSIKWERTKIFRRHIPFSLYHKTMHYVKMDINKPPMRAGKGENSWDCGDDGTFGMSAGWKFEEPTWTNREICTRRAIQYYVDSVMKDVQRYGGANGDRGISKSDIFTFIGRKPSIKTQQSET
jgi:hypothetical protein